MKHATEATLGQLEDFLKKIRASIELKEKSPGVFYLRSKAFLHFHEDPAGLFADVRTGPDWQRMRVSGRAEQEELLRKIRAHLGQG